MTTPHDAEGRATANLTEAVERVRNFAAVPLGDYDDITIFGTDDQPTVTYGDIRMILAALDRLTLERDVWQSKAETRGREGAESRALLTRLAALPATPSREGASDE